VGKSFLLEGGQFPAFEKLGGEKIQTICDSARISLKEVDVVRGGNFSGREVFAIYAPLLTEENLGPTEKTFRGVKGLLQRLKRVPILGKGEIGGHGGGKGIELVKHDEQKRSIQGKCLD